ncbi:BA75_02609T0 [Komagataella pastoris]|uniref:Protein YAE1 n=1 Tax=Komagataella pastoris TaxID=4922 RepID=A0A1B2JAD6_PICPA|nr:BA75_02609T0 [Komagataella pastoris]
MTTAEEDPKRDKVEQESINDDDDDIWGDEELHEASTEDNYGLETPLKEHVNTSALRRKHAKAGYLDGIGAAENHGLQDAFDEGYPMGAAIGSRIGQIIGTLYSKSNTELLEKAKAELQISKVLDSKYFDGNVNLIDDTLLTKWEAKLVNLTDSKQKDKD